VKETNANEKVISEPIRYELQKPSKSTQLTISSDFKLGPPAKVILLYVLENSGYYMHCNKSVSDFH
jgi:hypothetical protein